MDGNGALSNLVKPSSTSLALGPLSHLENQKLEREMIKSIPRVGDLWIPSNITIPRCYVQFYMPKIDDRIKIGNHFLRISHTGQAAHIYCGGCMLWIFMVHCVGGM
jgi:hypothetical protein